MHTMELQNISYRYTSKYVLENINMTFDKGHIYAITGPSGSGKTTLLSLMSGLSKLQEGTIYIEQEDIKNKDMYALRSTKIGMVFQNFNLLTKLTALENVILSMDIAKIKGINKLETARLLLEKVGLSHDEMNRRVLQLSGGQQQRVAIARALSYDPSILLADEPTGNLDPDTREEIMNVFEDLKKEGKCIILVTHDAQVADKADQIYALTKDRS